MKINVKYDIKINRNQGQKFDITFNVEQLINLNVNKAKGPDGIHHKILKYCARNLDFPLSLLFNFSYKSGIIPKDWKHAHIVPVFKKESKCKI